MLTIVAYADLPWRLRIAYTVEACRFLMYAVSGCDRAQCPLINGFILCARARPNVFSAVDAVGSATNNKPGVVVSCVCFCELVRFSSFVCLSFELIIKVNLLLLASEASSATLTQKAKHTHTNTKVENQF